MTKYITLTKGQRAIVDDDDYEMLSQYKWHFISSGYAARDAANHGETILMHRQILGAKPGDDVHHFNHCRIDNRRDNICICTRMQNASDLTKRSGTSSRYIGVNWFHVTNKWVASICVNHKRYHLGYFINEEDAAYAYRQAAIRLRSDLAFPTPKVNNG